MMSGAGGKVVRSQKEKSGKMNSSSQNGKPETTQTSKVQVGIGSLYLISFNVIPLL